MKMAIIQESPKASRYERDAHDAFTPWGEDHKSDYKHMGTVKFRPGILKAQRENQPSTPINRLARVIAKHESAENKATRVAVRLTELAYLKATKEIYAKAVGSTAVAEAITGGFNETMAFDHPNSMSLTEYAISCLENEEDMTLGLASAHLDRLADIGEFAIGLNLAIVEEKGFKYIERTRTLVNKNMTRESYYGIYLPFLLTLGTGVYWGIPPGESATKYGLCDDVLAHFNGLVAKQFINDKKEGSLIFAYVPAGSGATKVLSESKELEEILLKDPSYTAGLTARCRGGIVPVNRFGNEVAMGSVIENSWPVGMTKMDYSKFLTSRVVKAHAIQAHELTKVPVKFVQLHPHRHCQELDLRAAA